MSESLHHVKLVEILFQNIKKTLPREEHPFIMVDLPQFEYKPIQTIDGYKPDIYYCNTKHLILGEAKTSFDFFREHSINQYKSFIRKCEIFNGDSMFCIAVPWTESGAAYNMFKLMKKKNNFKLKIKILDDVLYERLI